MSAGDPAGPLPEGRPSRAYRFYGLVLLSLTFFLSYADRQVFGVLFTPLKQEFGFTDAELGLMAGLGFGVVYSLFSIPLARWADRSSRKKVLAICLTLWSGATMASGFVVAGYQLVLARMAVGIGEAGGTPAAVSSISDMFSKARRATAIGMYNAAGSLGGALVITAGAWLASHYGWRVAFIGVGVPGLLLTLLILLTFREPVRGESDPIGTMRGEAAGFGETISHIWRQKALVLTIAGAGMSSGAVALTAWLPAFMERSHNLSLAQAGGAVGLALLLAGPFGEFVGGTAADRLGRRGVSPVLYSVAGTAFLTVIFGVGFVMASSVLVTIILMTCWKVFATAFPPPAWGLSQSLVDARMRATSQAVMGVVGNLFGYGFGPALAGLLSEMYRPALGEESLRWALMTATVFMGTGAALFYILGARVAKRDYDSGLDSGLDMAEGPLTRSDRGS